MNRKRTGRIIGGGLLGLGAVIYVAAKIDFYTHYDPHLTGVYLHKHVYYWAGMVVIGLLLWLTGKVFFDEPSDPPKR
jgi:hypothetical protein